MTVIGFSFTKMLIEKSAPVKGKISINNNVGIKNLEETKLNINSDRRALKLDFEFSSTYEPDIGKILLTGEVIYLAEKSKAEDAVKNWKKNKKIEKEMMTKVLNNVLAKCNIQALILSKDMNLPPPIPLPKVDEKGRAESAS
jgi:osmotically-inducible protein OsmY